MPVSKYFRKHKIELTLNICSLKMFTKVTKSDNKTCFTQECIQAASEMLERMDHSVDPCEDFYSFSCGNFIKNVYIPKEVDHVSIYSSLEKRNERKLKNLLSSEVNAKDIEPFRNVKNFYSSCIQMEDCEFRSKTEAQRYNKLAFACRFI